MRCRRSNSSFNSARVSRISTAAPQERALEGRSVGGRAVGRENVLDRPLEERTQSFDDLLARHALGKPALHELDALAAVDERVADRDSAVALDPEQDVVRWLPPGKGLDSDGQPVAGREHLRGHPNAPAVVVRGGANTGAPRLSERLGASRSCQ
jgi:hypothetical protein